MSSQPSVGKRRLVVETLAQQIHSGQLAYGHRLDGEHQLAETFDVSRGTIRQALTELQHRNLITTHSGIGSFVTFDGHQLTQRNGWAQALAQTGTEIATTVLSIEPVRRAEIPRLPAHVALTDAIAVRRLRSTPGDVAGSTGAPAVVDGASPVPAGHRIISFECASVPATAQLIDLPRRGLTGGSLWTTLRDAGLVAARGEQSIDVHTLDAREAGILRRPVGTAFLRSIRTSFSADGVFVEHVVSLLDPQRFTITSTFGEDS